MKNKKQDFLIINGLLLFMLTICTYHFFKAPLEQVNQANPEKMKVVMEEMMGKIQLLEQQHSKLPDEKDWQKALSPYVYDFDYDVYVWNKKQEGIYYANMQNQVPLLLKNHLNNAILKEPTSTTPTIHFIEYQQSNQSRFGYFAYISKWKVYVSLTGTDQYFKSPESLLREGIAIEILLLFFAVGLNKEIMRKQYFKPLNRIVAVLKKEYEIDVSNVSGEAEEFESIAQQLELISENRLKEKSGAS